MNKEHLTIFVITLVLLATAIRYTDPLHDYFLEGLNGVKSAYWRAVESVEETIDEHIDQKNTIIRLREENARFKEDHILLASIATEFNALLAANKSKLPMQRSDVQLARAISYAKFGDRNKVWLEVDHFDQTKMYGLMRNGQTAGIVIEKLGKPLALLNNDPKSSYAVYVGDVKAPGIARGKNSEEMLVEFIPTWMKIREGDVVKTSGLDHLFFEGVPVGKVLSLRKQQGFQTAIIQPYANTDQLGFFHMIEQAEINSKVRPQK